MLPYWIMFAVWGLGALQAERRREQDGRTLFYVAATVAMAAAIGLRFQVGGDWGTYLGMYDGMYFLSLPAAITTTDPGYATLNWLSARVDGGIWPVNLACGALFMGGVAYLGWRQPNPFLMILTAVPYLIIVVAMGYTRQAAAIGIICYAVADASEKRLVRLVVLIGIASLFHKSAVLVLPLLLVPVLRRNLLLGVIGALLFAGLFVLVLRDSSDRLIANYVQSNYDSEGAAIRVGMNVLAGSLFLLFSRRMELPPFQKSYWMISSILALISVPALILVSASSGIDRVSLYLIPLQCLVFSRLPYALGRDGKALPSVLLLVVGYSFLVQFVWLNYADNARSWLPYRTVVDQAE